MRSDGRLNISVVEKTMSIEEIDGTGLDKLDRAFLRALISTYRGGPAGIEAIAATMGQSRDTLEDMVEPFLLQRGFVTRTRQGRCATHRAYGHLGLEMPREEECDSAPPAEPGLFDD